MHLIDKKVNLSEHKADRQTSKEMTFSLTAHTTKLLKESRFPFLLLNKQMGLGVLSYIISTHINHEFSPNKQPLNVV